MNSETEAPPRRRGRPRLKDQPRPTVRFTLYHKHFMTDAIRINFRAVRELIPERSPELSGWECLTEADKEILSERFSEYQRRDGAVNIGQDDIDPLPCKSVLRTILE